MSNEEDYSDMPPLVYDDAPAHETTQVKNETKPSSLFVETNSDEDKSNNDENEVENEKDENEVENEKDENEVENEKDENEEENEDEGDGENEDESDVENENVDEDDNVSDDDDMFVLTDDQKPVRCSADYHALCRYRDHLVQKETRQFHDIGSIYVSHNKEETVLSYKDRNLIWNTERILKTFTIHRINKI